MQPIADKQTTTRRANFPTSIKLQTHEKPETTTETCRKAGKSILENTEVYAELSVFHGRFEGAVTGKLFVVSQ